MASSVFSYFFLFEARGLFPRTVLGSRESLALPLTVGFKINVKNPKFGLLAKAQFLVKPPRAKIVLQWSISAASGSIK